MTATTTKAPATAGSAVPQPAAAQVPAEVKPNAAERFTAKVMKEFGSTVGEIQVTDYHRH